MVSEKEKRIEELSKEIKDMEVKMMERKSYSEENHGQIR
jgi:hypothetical protein